MDFTAEVYRTAADEHVTVAFELYQSGRYVLAHYVAGLSVECLLRAYRYRLDPAFDERHNLYLLAKAARFYDVVPQRETEKVSAALGAVIAQWQNNHRFRSESALRSFLVERKLYVGIKGDFVKENTRRIVNAAFEIVNLGSVRWNR